MSDLISREDLIEDLRSQYETVFVDARMKVEPSDFYVERRHAYNAAMVKAEIEAFFEYLHSRPTVEAEPVKRGEWIEMVFTDTGKPAGYKCSECGLGARKKFAYCHCGAKMNTKEDDHK